jgi:hypothetical protein
MLYLSFLYNQYYRPSFRRVPVRLAAVSCRTKVPGADGTRIRRSRQVLIQRGHTLNRLEARSI